MSTDRTTPNPAPEPQDSGAPELTPLGKRIEVLRIQRGLSKQHLARFADASRQQLWRVLTGKSELTDALAARLADALGVPVDTLREPSPAAPHTTGPDLPPLALALCDPAQLAAVFALLSAGDESLRLRRALLDAAEDLCLVARLQVPAELMALRGQVLSGATMSYRPHTEVVAG